MVLNLKGNEIKLKPFSKDQIDTVLAFQDDVIDRLEDQSIFVKETREECLLALSNGIVIGAYLEDELVGIWSLVPFGEREENYAYDFEFAKEKVHKTINFAHAIVKENARGMGLDKKAVNYAVELMKERFDYFACTIAQTNLPSIKAMVRNGFYITLFRIKYGSFPRYVLLRDEKEKPVYDENSKVTINYEKHDEIIDLLSKGYCVCNVTKENNFEFYKKALVEA